MDAVVDMEENSRINEIVESSGNNEMNSEHNGMETAENQKALEEAKEEVEKVWKNAFKVEAWKSIKPDDLFYLFFYVQQIERKIFSNFKRIDYCEKMLSKMSTEARKTEKFMDASEVPDTEISSVRTAAAADSVVGGQGHVHCDCLMKCETKRCKCKKEGRLCNSRCHNQRDCSNK
uniref:Uncharacterized protein n=1 Tax=Panagrolaimus davidi TaxID=227884 RepID=A0A914QH12_9BILA